MKQLLAMVSALALLLAAVIATAAPKPPRPTAGIGVLLVLGFPADTVLADTVIPLFAEPGIGRLPDLPATKVNLLAPVLTATAELLPVAVTERRGEWLRIVYDDAGREGWVKQERPWDYTPWEEYLKGQAARLLPGLRKNYYALLREPAEGSAVMAPLSQDEEFRLIGIEGDWALAMTSQAKTGWLRWRDRDHRFMIKVGAGRAQKR